MVSLVMLAIMAGCAVALFLKGTLVQGITLVFNAIIAGFVAFGFFEMLARFLVKYSPGIALWAPLTCFLLLFVLGFAVLQTAAMQLGKEKADLGKLPEQIGRVACGIILGYVITGHLLVAAAMGPLPNQYPYPRFEDRNPNASRPNKPILSPDGFVTGLFAIVSKGSFSAISEPKSFAVLHADFLDQLYLNRHEISQKVPIMTSLPAVDVPGKGVRRAPDGLRDSEGKTVSVAPGEDLMLVRMEMKPRTLNEAGKFTPSQLRLVCVPKTSKAPLAGQGQAVYALGYIGGNGRLERKTLDEIITVQSSGDAVNMDVAFSVPSSLTPRLLEFKRNNLVQVQLSAPASGEQALEVIPFNTSSEAAPEPQPPAPESTPSAPPSSNENRRGRGLSDISQSVTGPLDEN
jgi:hypothetical protein